MERTKVNRIPDAILTSDWHLREDTPTCFTGDFQKEQWDAVKFINHLQEMHECPVIHAGDLFHHWKPSPWLISQVLQFLPNKFYTIYGQHDLPQHNWELRNKSGIQAIEMADRLSVLPRVHYGQRPEDFQYPDKIGIENWLMLSNSRNILVWHHLTYQTKPFPGAEGGMAAGILRKYPQFDLIVTGDNHQSFTEEYEGRLLVNPGNLTRQVADQKDFKPRVYLWYANTNTVTSVYLPIQEGVISREHIEVKEERDARIDAFVSRLTDEWDASLSFEDNIERFCEVNSVNPKVKEIIYKVIA